MANKRNSRKKRRGIFGAVIAVLMAAVIMCVLVVAIMHIPGSRIAAYPVKYTDEIIAAAQANSIPAPYIAAVIMAESSYDPGATSSVGAMGLMQIMPDTGQWIAGKYNETLAEGGLYDAATSIRYGAWYLGFLMDRYNGDMRCATAAYHAGQGTVDKWLDDPAYSADGITLTVIPYESTNTYVGRVLKYYEFYEKAYEEIAVQ